MKKEVGQYRNHNKWSMRLSTNSISNHKAKMEREMSINERKDKEFKVTSRRCNINDRISKRKKRTERGEATVN